MVLVYRNFMQSKTPVTSLYFSIFLMGIGVFFAYVHTWLPYQEYKKLWEYRVLHPEIIIPSPALRLLSIGHTNTHADVLWIRLMQFIGDNIAHDRYLEFTHLILSQVQSLNPYFAWAYELDIILLPSLWFDGVDDDNSEKKRKFLAKTLWEYDAILPRICDIKKLQAIDTFWFWLELLEQKNLYNPCISGLIPYYIASRYDIDLQDKKKAAYFYKIASMHDWVPEAAKFLGIIAFANTWNYRDAALALALLAHAEYDEYPYACQNLSLRLINDLNERSSWSWEWIRSIEQEQKKLQKPSQNSPFRLTWSVCYDFLERSVKQVYIGYITDITNNFPDIQSERDIIESGILSAVPKTASQTGFTILKKNGIWKYGMQ